ncbi:GNAT family N-acetyltransferase [Paenibacillus sp. OV219]|uniref:GNAT family N-acetyltransferase n=1 Tax=Paenibacillus sp. OV219 TaxID=1884377 RepID=UPI0008CBD73F|nr:GNAT family N-acetyltransferase [Paenibacillus sp. OV219]SEM71261.1 phosphinothricin acetyltransferase [Paenibacillus sp. OV219]
MSELTFESYSDTYLEAVCNTYNYYVERTTVTYDLCPYTTDQMKQLIEPLSDLYRSYVVLVDGQYAGYVLLTQHKKRPAFNVTAEVSIYLDQAFIGQGIGRKAAEFIERVARELNFHSLLAAICTENTGSVALFEKLGYKQVAYYQEIARKFDRWLDSVSFQKILA